MFHTIHNVLTGEELTRIQEVIEKVEFVSGKMTAGGSAAEGKDNLQLPKEHPEVQSIMKLVLEALKRNQELYSIAYPRQAVPPLFSRYEAGMTYGNHVDAAMMRVPGPLRTDVGLTLFLSNPDSYEGGELVVQLPGGGEKRTKLPSGSLVAYPTYYLHRVEPVTKGIRYAAVTWIESLIPDTTKRQILSDLERTCFALKHKHGNSEELNTLYNTFQNLLRIWLQP